MNRAMRIMRSLLASWSIDDRSGTVQWRHRTHANVPTAWAKQTQRVPPPLLRQSRLTCSNSARLRRSQGSSFPFLFKRLPQGAILDSHKPNQYGPRGFGGGIVVILLKLARVSKAWPTTHAREVTANDRR